MVPALNIPQILDFTRCVSVNMEWRLSQRARIALEPYSGIVAVYGMSAPKHATGET